MRCHPFDRDESADVTCGLLCGGTAVNQHLEWGLRHEFGIKTGIQPIIAIYERDVFSGGEAQTSVARDCLAGIHLMANLYAGVFEGIIFTNLSTIVRGAVIYQNDFQMRICLTKDGIDALPQVRLGFVHRNDHAESRGQ